jgi:hypothetical protein
MSSATLAGGAAKMFCGTVFRTRAEEIRIPLFAARQQPAPLE